MSEALVLNIGISTRILDLYPDAESVGVGAGTVTVRLVSGGHYTLGTDPESVEVRDFLLRHLPQGEYEVHPFAPLVRWERELLWLPNRGTNQYLPKPLVERLEREARHARAS